jgi:hypothetical protein
MEIHLNDWILEVDVDQTSKFYNDINDEIQCDCLDCKNYRMYLTKSGGVRSFFSETWSQSIYRRRLHFLAGYGNDISYSSIAIKRNPYFRIWNGGAVDAFYYEARLQVFSFK